MSQFFTKDKIGTKVVLMPEGNSVNRSKGSAASQAVEAVLVDIKKVKVTIQILPDGPQKEFKIGVGPNTALRNDSNYGYRVFASWEDFNAYRVAEEVKVRLRDEIMGPGRNISSEQYSQIAELLGWNDLLDRQHVEN